MWHGGTLLFLACLVLLCPLAALPMAARRTGRSWFDGVTLAVNVVRPCFRNEDGGACERRYHVEGVVYATLSSPNLFRGKPQI